jgi:hypothetical protein
MFSPSCAVISLQQNGDGEHLNLITHQAEINYSVDTTLFKAAAQNSENIGFLGKFPTLIGESHGDCIQYICMKKGLQSCFREL